MALPTSPPRYASWTAMTRAIERGATGWPVFSIQRAVGVAVDGVFGALTEAAVKKWQAYHKLTADGKVGEKTQAAMLKVASAEVDTHYSKIPDGLLDGFARVEGADLLAATNWSVPGGVDCGAVQRRVYGPPYDFEALKAAFDCHEAFTYAARVFTGRVVNYAARNGALSPRAVVEAAVLAHNWPAGADQIVRYGHILSPDEPALWTQKPDGTHYTRGEWAKEYPRRVLLGVDY
jgi:hypothetical protein